MKHESGRSMIEMIMVLSLIGILTIGSIKAYQSGNAKNDANKIAELVSTASLQGLTRMKNYNDRQIWNAIGKEKADYGCVDSMSVDRDGRVTIIFQNNADCNKIKNTLTSQWGIYNPDPDSNNHYGWESSTNTYHPHPDDNSGL